MLRKMIIGLAAAASLTGAALTPALATIPQCMEAPNADTCPYGGAPKATTTTTHVHKGIAYGRYHREPMVKKS
jgi:hypothetical protein